MPQDPAPISPKVLEQLRKVGLPDAGAMPFPPKLITNRRGDAIAQKVEVSNGPKKGKRGWLDDQGRIWVRDRAHAGLPDHWDVQINGGQHYIRVSDNGELIA